MKLFTLVTLLSLFAVQVNASHHQGKKNRCLAKLKLTKEQKQEMKQMRVGAKKEVKALLPALKAAKKNFRKVLLDSSTTREELVAARMELRKNKKAVRKVKSKTKMNIAFNVLSGQQRVKMAKCRMKKRSRK